jgi:immunity protein, SdpI family
VRLRLSDFLSIAAILAVCALGLSLYPSLPARIPIHWNLDGAADAFGAKSWAVAMHVAVPVGVYLLLKLLPHISPQGFRMKSFEGTMDILVLAVTLALAAMSGVALLSAAGEPVVMATLRPLILGGLFVVIGNYLGKVRKNFFVGIRTPWTLASDEVWARTHRVGGWLFVLAGIAVIATVFVPERFVFVLLLSIGAAALISVAYSFVVYRKLHGFDDPMDRESRRDP